MRHESRPSRDNLKMRRKIFSYVRESTFVYSATQDTIESKLEKRTKNVYIPVGGKTMIAFMDDFNMPMKETYGSQPPLELIRLWLDYNFW